MRDKVRRRHAGSWKISVSLFTADSPEEKVALFFENWNLDFSLS